MTIRESDDKIVNVAENGRDFTEENEERRPQGIGEQPGIRRKRTPLRGQKNLKKVVDKKKAMW